MRKQALILFYAIFLLGNSFSTFALQNGKAPELLICSATGFWGWQDWRNKAAMAEFQGMLRYTQKMGYTHVTYNNEAPVAPIFCRDSVSGKWVYNHGNYHEGLHYDYLKFFKAHADSAGLQVIPVSLVSLSHQPFLNVFTMIFTMRGGGAGLCSPTTKVDNYRFVNRPGLRGNSNLSLRCRVTDVGVAQNSATGLAGIMVRQNLNPNSAFVSVGLGTDGMLKIHTRSKNGAAGKMVTSVAPFDAHPFLQILFLRDSSKVIIYQGDAQGTMHEITRVAFSFSGQCQFGLFATAGDDRFSCDARFEYMIYNTGTDPNTITWTDGSWSDDVIGKDVSGAPSHIDNSYAELHDPQTKAPTWDRFCESCRAGQKCDPHFNHIAYLGDYVSNSDKLHNVQADELFEEEMKIISEVYKPAYPEFISIGFDELGWSAISYLKNKNGASYNVPYGVATLIAALIKFRIDQVDRCIPQSKGAIKIILIGDSFTSGDYGEFYGDSVSRLCGDPVTGSGGVLDKIKKFGLGNRIYVAPWMYDWKDSDKRVRSENDNPTCPQIYSPVVWDRIKQIRFLDTLGIRYLLGPGEGGKPENVQNNLQCLFEWMRTAAHYPQCWAGSINYIWEGFNNANRSVYTGYSLPALAYLTKYPYLTRNYNSTDTAVAAYFPDVFSGVRYVSSRTNKTWQYTSDYTTGLSLCEMGSASNIAGAWNNELTHYTLTGKSRPLGETSDNFIYAYAVHEGDFECIVKIDPADNVVQKGLMIRESLDPGSKYIHLHSNKSLPNLRLAQRHVAGGPTIEEGAVLSRNNLYIKVVRQGTKTRWYAGADGRNFTFIKEYTFRSGMVFIGLTHAGSGILPATTTFSSFSLVNK